MKLFITGTDTGVGKTWISAALATALVDAGNRVLYYKPIQTGCEEAPGEDALFVQGTLGESVAVANRYCFPLPAAPAAADPEETINCDLICQDAAQYDNQWDWVLIEGAGGLAVPINRNTLMIDLIKALDVPVLLVSHSRLGTMNHTLLSIEALQRRNIPIAGVVFNFYPTGSQCTDPSIPTLIDTLTPHLPQNLPYFLYPDTLSTPKTPYPASNGLPPGFFDFVTKCKNISSFITF